MTNSTHITGKSKDYLTIHLKNLVSMARADGVLDNNEILFLYKIGKRYQLNPQIIAEILTDKSSETTINVSNVEDNLEQLSDMVGMMLADGIIKDKEMEFCKKICDKYNFKPEVIDLLIELYGRKSISTSDWESLKAKAILMVLV